MVISNQKRFVTDVYLESPIVEEAVVSLYELSKRTTGHILSISEQQLERDDNLFLSLS